MSKPIRVYMHINDLPGAWNVLEDQINRMAESGLLDAAERVILCTNGLPQSFEAVKQTLKEFSNIEFAHVADNAIKFEYPTLNKLKQDCDATEEDFYICYLHLKGLTKLNDPNVIDWRNYMEYWNIDRWKECVAALDDDCETVGTNFIETPWPHYSGNFWWSHANYIKRLDPLVDPDNLPWGQPSRYINATLDGGNFRYEHEAWVTSGDPDWYEIDSTPGKTTPGWHFNNLWPEDKYIVKEQDEQVQ